MDEAFFAIDLPKETLATADFRTVFLVVSGLFVRQYVAQRRIGAEGQAADFIIDLTDRPEGAGEIDVRLDVHRRQSVGELPGLLSPIVALYVFSRSCDGQHVQQL